MTAPFAIARSLLAATPSDGRDRVRGGVRPADLFPNEVYAMLRPQHRPRLIEKRRRRRVSVGPHVSLSFESRETVLYQIQEVLWVEQVRRPGRIEEEIAEYERLVPRAGELTATLMIHGGPLGAGQALVEGMTERAARLLFLGLGERAVDAELLPPVGDPSCPVQYLRFPLDRDTERRLLHGRGEAWLGLGYAGEAAQVPLPQEAREEIAADLRASRANPL